MARNLRIVVTLVLLATLFLSTQHGMAVMTYGEMQVSIDLGFDWLAGKQKPDGSWAPDDLLDCSQNHRVEMTSLAVLKMNDRARELGTDPTPAVQKGLNFIFSKVQEDGSIWDYYDPCGQEKTPDTVTETSFAIMAIVSTGTPGAVVSDGPANGMSYSDVVEDAVAYLAWAQRTREEARMSGFDDEGGWTGGKDPEGTDPPGYYAVIPADQIHTGIASLALSEAAEKFRVTTPPETLSRLETWINNIQDSPGSGGAYFWAPPFDGLPNIHFTGDLLIEQHLLGLTSESRDVQAAIRYISDSWSDRGGSYKDYFLLTSGLSLQGVETLQVGGSDVDWFDAILVEVTSGQKSDGSWPEDFVNAIRPTGYALLTIEGHVYPGEMTVTKKALVTDISPSGTAVTYTYTVQNTGRSAIYDLTLEDDRLATIGTPPTGDDGDGILEPGETWTYTGYAVLSVTTRNIGTASGVDLLDRSVVATSNPVTVIVNGVTGMDVSIDIKPASCPNAFNLGEVGVITVAVLGTEDFDVTQIDPETIYLGTVRALSGRWSYEDVATPYEDLDPLSDPIPEDCTTFEADGYTDLTLKFDHRAIADSLDPVPRKKDLVSLTLTGTLKEEFDFAPFAGTDYIWIVE